MNKRSKPRRCVSWVHIWKNTLWKINFGKKHFGKYTLEKKHFGNRSLQAVGHSFRKTFDDGDAGDDGEDGGDDDNDDVNFMLT